MSWLETDIKFWVAKVPLETTVVCVIPCDLFEPADGLLVAMIRIVIHGVGEIDEFTPSSIRPAPVDCINPEYQRLTFF